MTDWWVRTDRQEALAAFRGTVPHGGCVVLVGGEGAGLRVAARLIAAEAVAFGYSVHGVSRIKRRTSVKQLMLNAWELIAPELPGTAVRRWRVPGARLPLDEIVDELGHAVRGREQRTALLFDTPDLHDRLTDEETKAFSELATSAAAPIVVTSSLPSRSPWQPGGSVCQLGDFRREDILEVLMRSPKLAGSSLRELHTIADMVMGNHHQVEPEIAYTRLVAWSRS